MNAPNATRPTVLLLEDEPALAQAVLANLNNRFEFEVAANAEEAMLLLGTRRFDAILSDHMLPGKMQGLDFLVAALERQPSAKRVLITGYMNPDLLSRGASLAKLSAVLLKPTTMEHIRKVLDDAIAAK
jgi:DNA-binding NtrC family response regulator